MNSKTHREIERERRKSTGVRNPSPLSSTPCTNERETQLHPTRSRRSEVPHTSTSSAAVPDPLNLAIAHFELCMYPIHQGKTLPHAGETHLTSNISDSSLPHANETLLSNPPSTIPDPPKTDLDLDPPKTDLVVATKDRRCRWRPISLILILWIKDVLVGVSSSSHQICEYYEFLVFVNILSLGRCFYFDFWLCYVYILNFFVIKFVWKMRKWLRKCEKFVGK